MAGYFFRKHFTVKSLLFLILALVSLEIFCQQSPRALNVELYSGMVQNTTSNRLLNYYTYSGADFMPLLLAINYKTDKSLYTLSLHYNKSRLKPVDIEKSYYPHIYLDQSDFEYDLAYYRKVISKSRYLSFYVGISNNSYFVTQKQYYENQLFDNTLRYRKAYTYSFNFSPGILMDFIYNRHKIEITTSYSLINVLSYPDDNYVKQIGFENQHKWTISLLKDPGFDLSAAYKYSVTSSIDIIAQYNVSYFSVSSPESKYLQELYLVGIAKTF
jgi:hypothetical protein